MSEDEEPEVLLTVSPQDIQAVAKEMFGRDLDEGEVQRVVHHLREVLNSQVEWFPLLKRCIEEVALRSKYEGWLRQVGEAVWNMAGCGIEDLPDFDYFSLFMVGSAPEQAADAVLLSVGFSRFG
jgi:hypothetical protein